MHYPLLKTEALGELGGNSQGQTVTAEGAWTATLAHNHSTAARAAQPPSFVLYCDGACEPYNPGGWATWGWAAFDAAGEEIANGRGCAAHGRAATNNLAEYTAALEATDWARAQGLSGILVRVDSKLVAEQVSGSWQCNAPHLRPLRDELRARLAAIEGMIEWIPRTANTRADALSRLAYAEARRGATQ